MSDEKDRKRHLVQETAAQLRDVILACESGTQIGSLKEIAARFDVGIVTVQQAARVLEHEGLLEVKRGPGGGYYGARPDAAALDRAFATYMRVHNFGYREAFEMMILLDCDIIRAAAGSQDESLHEAVAGLVNRIEQCQLPEHRVQFEQDLRDSLFKVVNRPFLELLARVAMQLYKSQPNSQPGSTLFSQPALVREWEAGRRRILRAILQRDQALAGFEAERYRQMVLGHMRSGDSLGTEMQ